MAQTTVNLINRLLGDYPKGHGEQRLGSTHCRSDRERASAPRFVTT
jgi:hypothetical protein